MRIHTLTGDIIDLRFLWPPGTMHLGRQAARRYAERMERVGQMRTDDGKANGWEVMTSNEVSPDGTARTVRYAIVAPPTEDELAIPKAELFVRDKLEPMVNVPTDDVGATASVAVGRIAARGDAPTPNWRAIVARFQAAINAALTPSETP